MSSAHPPEVAWSAPVIARIVYLVGERSGLAFPKPRNQMIEATIRREAGRSGRPRLEDYEAHLLGDANAVDSLAAELTVGETYFFRDPGQFDVIRRDILPRFAGADAGGRAIHVWSAGCASGEEAYSLAIVSHELGLGARTKIVGTDLSRERLQRARAGKYGRWSLRGLSDDITNAYFRRRNASFQLVSPIREMVEFRHHNLADIGEDGSLEPRQMDLILCRNVLIYFDASTIARVVPRLFAALSDTGWLLLGASDPPASDYVECEVQLTPAGLAYRRAIGRRGPQRSIKSAVDAPARSAPALVPAPCLTFEPPAELLAEREIRRTPASETAGTEDATTPQLAASVLRIRSLADGGALDEAGQLCAAALERHPLSAELTYLQALLLAQAGQYAAAAEAARRSVYLDRTLAVGHMALGDALARMGRRDDAARAFRSARRLLAKFDADAVVPASGGERSARLNASVVARLQLMASVS